VIKHIKVRQDLRSFILIIIAIAWLSGIMLESWLPLPQLALIIGAAVALACVILFWRDSRLMLVSLVILWLFLGAWRYAISSPVGDPQSISTFIGAGTVEILGTIADDPKLLDRSRLLLVAVSNVSTNGGTSWQDAHGQIEVQIPGAPPDNPYGPNYGDDVEIQGKVQPPFPHHSPEVLASLTFPRLNIVGSAGNPVITALLHLRLALASIITQSLPQPMAALPIAIVLSLQTPAIKPLTQAFISTGTAHLIAPSGFKVTILAGLVAGSMSWIYKRRDKQLKPLLPAQKREGYWRRWLVTSLVILSIIAYSILSGAGPAAQRACIMGIILVLAPRFGRVYNIYTAMALAILITEAVAITLAAEIATLPIIALTFNQVSLIAVLANVLTVPLLSILIMLGLALCVTGAIFLPLGLLCGWIIWPLLQYTILVIKWCASIPWAFLTVSNLDPRLAWCYYGVLILILSVVLRKWPLQNQQRSLNSDLTLQSNHFVIAKPTSPLPPRILPVLRYAAVLIVILATGSTIAAAPANEQLSIILLNVGPAGKPSQGEAMLIHTVDGKTILIDGGLDTTSLAQELDSRLPFWEHSIDTVILTSPRQDHIIGAQEVISRFQIGEVLDPGMLHPSTAYALWKRTINDRNLPYSQVREGDN
jgi:competence protein ComEC